MGISQEAAESLSVCEDGNERIEEIRKVFLFICIPLLRVFLSCLLPVYFHSAQFSFKPNVIWVPVLSFFLHMAKIR